MRQSSGICGRAHVAKPPPAGSEHGPRRGRRGPRNPDGGTVGHGDPGPSRGRLGYIPSRGRLGHIPSRGRLGHIPSRGRLGHIPSRGRLGTIESSPSWRVRRTIHARAAPTIRSKLDHDRRDLLDLTLRNPLLNYRTRSRGVTIVEELPAQVFQVLVREGKRLSFLPAPEPAEQPDSESESESGVTLAQPEESDRLTIGQSDLKLQTTLPSDQLQAKLLAIYYAAPDLAGRAGSQHALPRAGDAQLVHGRRSREAAAGAARAGPGRAGAVQRAGAVPAAPLRGRPGRQSLPRREAEGRIRADDPRSARRR